jgi:uncharacterized protein HemX
LPLTSASCRLGVALLIAMPTAAGAVCSVQQQQAKIAQINAMIEKNPAQAKTLREGLHQALLLDGDESCAGLDKVIAGAK